MIRESPDFPPKQVPSLMERNEASVERIILAPLPKNGDLRGTGGEESDIVSKNLELLDLKFILEKCPTKGEVAELAKGVNMMIQKTEFGVHRVIWGGLHPWPAPRVDLHHPIVQEAAKRFMGLSRQRAQRNSRQTSKYLQPPSPISSHSPDPSEPATPLTPLEALIPESQCVDLYRREGAHDTTTAQMFHWFQTAFTYLWVVLISHEIFLIAGVWVIVLLTNES